MLIENAKEKLYNKNLDGIVLNLSSRLKSGLIKEDSLLLAKYNHGQKWIIITQHNLMELFGYNFLKKLENK